MATEIITNQTPEERELEKKQGELLALEEELIQRELDLATLRAELSDFEGRYLRTVGVLYAELDEIEAQIAEAKARRNPSDSQAQDHAARARAQAEESCETARAITEPRPKPTESLKRLFREWRNAFTLIWRRTTRIVRGDKNSWSRLTLPMRTEMTPNYEAFWRIGKAARKQLRAKGSEPNLSV
jgi:uncharacterized coiled-coil DUF342 family protein